MKITDKILLNLEIRKHLNNYWPFSQFNPWEVAFQHGNLKLSELLLEAKISAKDLPSHIVMSNIINNSQSKTDKVLINALDAGLNPNMSEKNGFFNTLLHKYAAGNHEKVVRKLIEKGANIEAVCGNGYTPICVALSGFGADAGLFKDRDDVMGVVDALLNAGADVEKLQGKYKYSLLEFAPMNLNVWKKLIKKGAPLRSNHPEGNDLEKLEHISSFHRIDEVGDNEIIKWIQIAIDSGVDNNTKISKGNNLFFHLLLRQREIKAEYIPQMITLFIENGFELENENKDNVFHQIFKSANIPNIKKFLQYFAEHQKIKHLVSNKNKDGLTPLDILSTRQNCNNNLLANGTHPNYKGVVVKDMFTGVVKSEVFDVCEDMLKVLITHNFKEHMKNNISKSSKTKTRKF